MMNLKLTPEQKLLFAIFGFVPIKKEKNNIPNIPNVPNIKDIIINENKKRVVILFKDGSKSISKCHPEDTFDAKVGFSVAYAKHLFKNNEKFTEFVNYYVSKNKNIETKTNKTNNVKVKNTSNANKKSVKKTSTKTN